MHKEDSINLKTDSNYIKSDTIKKVNGDLKSKVVYTAKDSVVVNIEKNRVFLFNNADVTYENINIKAAYVEISFKENLMFAKGKLDSTAKLIGTPVFTQEKETFTADEMTYNFKTKKGIIKHIMSKQGDGYIHGVKVKRMPDNVIFIRSGSYTTCSLNDPHFDIRFTRAKVIPDDKIICGPALMYIEDIPTPIAVPFGYFPINKGRRSGLIIPAYGESANRGYFFENLGYYWGINDNIDMSFKGDIYTRGSWTIKQHTNYIKKYKYNGFLDLAFANNITSEKNLPDYSENKDFFIRWTHNQDEKARPNSRFSANVNAGSSKFNTFNPSSTSDYLTNTFQSNISYSTTINSNYNLSLNLRHSQNTQTKIIDLSLPEMMFSVNRFYPFQRKNNLNKQSWLDKISISYTMQAKNQITSPDSLLFKSNISKRMNNGIMHSIPVSSSFKLLRYFTMTNTFNYNEKWYFKHIEKRMNQDSTIKTDTINGFTSERDFSFSSNINTKLYGMYQFRSGYIRAIRHVITPTVGFSYNPDFSTSQWGYFKEYTDYITNKSVKYSIFENSLYGGSPSGKSGSVNFAISNNIEMKVRSKKDTINGFKKIVLIENLTLSESYDIAKDSLRWSKLLLSGRTRLFKNIDLRYMSLFDPYIIDSLGRNRNKLEYDVNKRIFRRNSSEWAFSINWAFSSKLLLNILMPKTDKNKNNLLKNADFSIPWNINLYYTFQHTSSFNAPSDNFIKKDVQTLSFNGEISPTKKWKITYTSGYDFVGKKISYTSISIVRDLHCWEMVFNWIPNGFRKSYNFTIRAKASILQDLKLTKKTDWRDSM